MVICEPILRAIVDGLESQQHTIESFESEASPALSSVFGIRPREIEVVTILLHS